MPPPTKIATIKHFSARTEGLKVVIELNFYFEIHLKHPKTFTLQEQYRQGTSKSYYSTTKDLVGSI